MHKDVLGKNELESVKLNWDCAIPGLMTTRCCGTGTCDNGPNKPQSDGSQNYRIIHFFADARKIQDITMRYGHLRT